MRKAVQPWRLALVGGVALTTVMSLSGIGQASPGGGSHGARGAAARQQARNAVLRARGGAPTANHTPNDGDLADQFAAYANERTAPASSVSGAALVAAQQQAAVMPHTAGAWQEFTTQPYNAEPAGYTDPFWSNAGAGFSLVGGRTTALAATPATPATPDGTWFAGTADGGVWKSTDHGADWTPVFDSEPSLSIGALAVNPHDGSLWVGTGEANLSVDAYAGTGVYRSSNDGATFTSVTNSDGSNPLVSDVIFKIAFDQAGNAYAATNNGLWRYDASTGNWSEVLGQPEPAGAPPYDWQVTSVAVVPGTQGKDVIASVGWHGPGNTENNGFYESTDSGASFSNVTAQLTGDINASDIGRTTFAYSTDGTKLYAIVQSLSALANGDESVLQGVFAATGTPASVTGPWTKIADESKLAASGSALPVGSGYGVGVQAWYNQALAVDPANPEHVYLGLEEVFQTTDGGQTWNTASPYWNYGLSCGSACPNTTHPDQHAMMITDGKIVIGNDGGVYSRKLSNAAQYGGWTDLNATLHSWQYYDARAGALSGGGTGVVGGLQDNGTSYLATGAPQMVEPAGGDGFYVVVDPQNANNFVGEYTYGTMYSTTDGGHTYNYYVSPTCLGQEIVGLAPRKNCDPNPRFATPLTMDQQQSNVWLTGGQYVWVTHIGWRTKCSNKGCTWGRVFNTGSGHSVTALSSTGGGKYVYAAWVGGGGNPGPSFSRGIATNYGGTWHQIDMTGLPDRYIAGVTVDPSNPAHAYAVFNGYSRRWVPGGGVGHVFETFNGGATWTDISGNLPDIGGDALVIGHGELALATDMGVFTAAEGQGADTTWSVLGTGLPNASVNDLTVGPGGYIYAATHGRGVWRISF